MPQADTVLSRLEAFIERADAFPVRLAEAVVVAESESLDEGMGLFVRQSSGPLSRADLARMNHPYARRDPQTPLDPAMVNIGSGDFLREWQEAPIETTEDGTQGSVFNDSESAKWLATGGEGESRMVERPIVAHVALALAKPRKERLHKAALDALRGQIGSP
jgi:hypothetical protein